MKSFLLSLVIIFSVFTNSVQAQNGDMLKNGFGLKFHMGFPAANYGSDVDLSSDSQLDMTFGLQIGNQWYLVKEGFFGLALNVNWLDLNYGAKEIIPDRVLGYPLNRVVLEVSALEIGPLITFALNERVAFDGYWNYKPTVMLSNVEDNQSSIAYAGYGFTNAFGVGFRFGKLYLGGELNVGNLKAESTKSDFGDILPDELVIYTSQTKLIFGFKF